MLICRDCHYNFFIREKSSTCDSSDTNESIARKSGNSKPVSNNPEKLIDDVRNVEPCIIIDSGDSALEDAPVRFLS